MTRTRAPSNETGMATIEAVVLAPVIVVLLLFIVILGRVTTTQQTVQRQRETRPGPLRNQSLATKQRSQ